MRCAVIVVGLLGCGRLHFAELGDAALAPADVAADAYAGPNRAFVSSTTSTANLGGLAGADATCQALADAQALGGEFIALLWDGAITPSSRLAGSRGWVDLHGAPIADQPTDFDNGTTLHPIRDDETGTPVVGPAYTGYFDGPPCQDWTDDQSGLVNLAQSWAVLWWGVQLSGGCGQATNHLNCVERGHVVAVAPSSSSNGRIAFLSDSLFTPGGGFPAADALCAGDATAAGLPGTYLAWLTTSGGTADTRFTPGGEPYRRPDGESYGATADVWTAPEAGMFFDTFPTVTASGAFWNQQQIWVGGIGYTCTDWTTTATSGFTAYAGTTWRGDLAGGFVVPCAFPQQILCVQQ